MASTRSRVVSNCESVRHRRVSRYSCEVSLQSQAPSPRAGHAGEEATETKTYVLLEAFLADNVLERAQHQAAVGAHVVVAIDVDDVPGVLRCSLLVNLKFFQALAV